MNKHSLILSFLKQTHYHASWHTILIESLEKMDAAYLQSLLETSAWLPGIANIFNAFNLPLTEVRYILLGESPYPRAASANGYAFWDGAVKELWSTTGLSKKVNRATSLRNFIKMLLVADDQLRADKTQPADIAKLNKQFFIQTNQELFEKLLSYGFLLLNASLALESNRPIRLSSQYWLPFLQNICSILQHIATAPTFILFGNIAKKIIDRANLQNSSILIAEHPYNLSFISNADVIKLFKPLQLLSKSTGAT